MSDSRQSDGRRFVVYGLVDPRDGLVHYIGRTVEGSSRISTHWWSRQHPGRVGRRLGEWLVDLDGSDAGPFRCVLLQFAETFDAIVEAEGEWIRRGLEAGWPLTNRCKSGGSGRLPAAVKAARAGLAESAR